MQKSQAQKDKKGQTATTDNVTAPSPGPPSHHGNLDILRGIDVPRTRFPQRGRFGRMFHHLGPFLPDDSLLIELGKADGIMVAPGTDADSTTRFGGTTFLGQFLDHDITLDATSSLEQQTDPLATDNFRTPFFELDSVYDRGPVASAHLYDRLDRDKLLIGVTAEGKDDLPRNSQGTALIGDPRNDENLIVAQLHLAFLKFHNAVVDHVRSLGIPPGKVFQAAQQLTRWHYQWIIVHEFLPSVVDDKIVADVITNGRKFYKFDIEPFIPVEFAVAAYRFGHSDPARVSNGCSGIPLVCGNGGG